MRLTDINLYFMPVMCADYDGCFPRNKNERSFITCQVYLNDGFSGGSTRFFDKRLPGGVYDAVPEAGMAIFFVHAGWLHAGTEVLDGTKYIIRTGERVMDVECVGR